jgi:hypothetical protein
MNEAIPFTERLIGVFENRASNDREPIAVWGTFFALPMPLTIAATWAMDAVGPAPGVQVGLASVLIGEHRLELRNGQSVDLSGLFSS